MIPTFSVIIPVYNVEQHISRCLDSIISQTCADWEVILINDGSTDSSGTICDTYSQQDERIKVRHQQNKGVSSARNAGLEIASGEYISFIDPDDWIEQDMYQTLGEHIKNKDIDILRFNAYRKNEILNELPFKGGYSGKRFDDEIMLPLIGAEEFGGMFILGVLWLHIYKRSIIENNHIRFNENLRRCEDRLFTLTCALHSNHIMFIENILYHYEVYEDSLSNKYDPLRWQQELTYLDELRKEYAKSKSDAFIREADKRIESEYVLRSVTSLNNEFFSNNNNSFNQKYKNAKAIINNPNVKRAVQKTKKKSMGIKGKLTLGMIQYKLPFFLSLFNTAILLKNKMIKNG